MTARRRPWSVFVDTVRPRIVMTAQPIPEDRTGTMLTLDEERSTANVTIWLGNHGEPEVIEAEGTDDYRILQTHIGQVVYFSDRWVAGSPTPDAIPDGRWTRRHDALLVSRDVPADLPEAE